jgi:hypothetical protein
VGDQGVAVREKVVKGADLFVSTFDDLIHALK